MTDIYVVTSGRGEYSSRVEHLIAWYGDEATAKAHAQKALAWNQDFVSKMKAIDFDPWDDEFQTRYKAEPNPMDTRQGYDDSQFWEGLSEDYEVTKVPAGVLPEIVRRMP